jgi:hypothetical protein
MKQITLATALIALFAAPAFAQSLAPSPGTGDVLANRPTHHGAQSRHRARPTSAFGAVTPFGSPLAEPGRGGREASVRECNAEAAKTYAVRDSNWSLSLYRACMAQHGQPE